MLNKFKSIFTDPAKTVFFHATMVFVWMLLIIPTMLWLSESILWILLISIYANIVGHWSAYQAVSAELSEQSGLDNEDIAAKLDEVLQRLEQLEGEKNGMR